MIEIIGFVAACLVWQSVKDWLRGGRRKPELTVRMGAMHSVAKCGCDTVDGKVVSPCSAHRAMLGA